MFEVITALNRFSPAWSKWMWAIFWQVTAFVIVVWIITSVFRKSSSSFRYLLWLLVFIKLISPASFTARWSIGNLFSLLAGRFEQRETIKGASVSQLMDRDIVTRKQDYHSIFKQSCLWLSSLPGRTASMKPVTSLRVSPSLLTILMCAWSAIILFFLSFIIRQYLYYRRRILSSALSPPHAVQELFFKQMKRLNVRRYVRLLISSSVKIPAAFGLFRPTIVFPEKWETCMSSKQLSHVISHELAHVKRFDLEAGWLITLLCCIYWFHPAVWFAGMKLKREREIVCDDTALLSGNHARRGYTDTILRVAELYDPRIPLGAGFLGLFEISSNLLNRISSLRDNARPRCMGWRSLTGAFLLALLLIPMGIRENASSATANVKIPTPGMQGGTEKDPLEIIRQNAGNPELFLRISRHHDNLSNIESAIENCKKMLSSTKEMEPMELSDIYYRLWRLCITKSDYNAGIEFLEKSIEALPCRANCVSYLNMNHYKYSLNKLMVLKKLRNMIPKHADNPWLHYAIAEIYIECKNPDTAIRFYKRAIELCDSDNISLALVGDLVLAYVENGKFEKAREIVEKTLLYYPENYIAHVNCARFYARSGKYDTATRHLQTALELIDSIEDKHSILTEMARIYEMTQNIDRAIEIRKEMCLITENPWDVYYLGFLLMRNKRYTEAINVCEKARDLLAGTDEQSFPVLSHVYIPFCVAKSQLGLGRIDAAFETMSASAIHSTYYSLNHFGLAEVYRARKDFQNAEAEYKEAIRLSSGYPDALRGIYNQLIWMLARDADKHEKAIHEARKLMKVLPEVGSGYARLAEIHESLHHYHKAAEIYENFARTKVSPEDLRFSYFIKKAAIAYNKAGKRDYALKIARDALKINPTHFSLHRSMAEVYQACGLYDDALIHYRRALQLAPQSKKKLFEQKIDSLPNIVFDYKNA